MEEAAPRDRQPEAGQDERPKRRTLSGANAVWLRQRIRHGREEEVETASKAQVIFRSYLKLGSLNLLMADLRKQGIVTKVRTLKTGEDRRRHSVHPRAARPPASQSLLYR